MAINNGQDLSTSVIRKPTTVLSGATISTPMYVGGQLIVGIDCSALLTSTTVTFFNSTDGGKTYKAVENGTDGIIIAVMVEANKYVHIAPPMVGLDIVRLQMGSAEGADRVVSLILVP